jgi:ribonucleotide monophosphatase NagD (HAD superfamily)
MIGDDPLVEIVMARRAGAFSFGVTTGITSREDWRRQPAARRPHRVLDELRDVLDWVDAS